jgi:microcystin-dependent protein
MTQTPVSNLQASLTLTEFVDIEGVFPPRDGGGSGPFLGSIGIFAGPSFLFDAPAEGQLFPIAEDTALFSILGTDFGGNAINNFELPNLGGVEMIGAGNGPGLPSFELGETPGQASYDLTNAQLPPSLGGTSAPIDEYQPSLAVNYVINTVGIFPSGGGLTLNSLGVVSAFLGNFAPSGGELLCDGQLLPINQNQALFELLGTTYGGNGTTNFALPNLEGRDIVGSGSGFVLGEQVGNATVSLTNANSPLGSDVPINNQQPGLVLNYYIALSGIFPSDDNPGNSNQQTPFLGQIVASAANIPDPNGWALCEGQLLPINQFQALFSILGTTYGGNGTTNFALPNLEGRTVLGTGGSDGLGTLGQVSGANTITLTSANLSCFVTGTLILTDSGEVEVERLKVGDLVVTASGERRPIKWIGRHKVAARFADPLRSWPIRIRANALADGVPSRDLLLSADHAVLIDDILFQAGATVNGTSITRENIVPEAFTYYHVELDDHSLILAEGTQAETFIDNVDRMAFDNWPEYEALYPDSKQVHEMPYPRAKSHRQVPRAIRERIAARATLLGFDCVAAA